MENAVVIAADTFIVERKYYICVDFNNAIKVPDTIDEMPNSGNEVPDKTETVPDTMKKCRIVNRNNKFINMYWKMALLRLLKQ